MAVKIGEGARALGAAAGEVRWCPKKIGRFADPLPWFQAADWARGCAYDGWFVWF